VIRVEGHGAATIQGVISYKAEMAEPDSSSPHLSDLENKKEQAQCALKRARKVTGAIDAYMAGLDASKLDISKLGDAMDVYDEAGEKWGSKALNLEKEIEALDKEISKEREGLGNQIVNKKLRGVVILDLFADQGGDVSINLIYGVYHRVPITSY